MIRYLLFVAVVIAGAFTPFWSINYLHFAPILSLAIPISFAFHYYKPKPWAVFWVMILGLLIFQTSPSLLGDSYSLFSDAARQNRMGYFQYPRYHSFLAPLIVVKFFGLFAFTPYEFATLGKWMSILSGILYYLFLTLNMKHYPKGALVLYFIPATVLFFGYMELYGMSILLWYLTIHYLYMKKRIAWVFAILATLYQWSAGILILMLISYSLPKKWYYYALGAGIALSPLMVFLSPDFAFKVSLDNAQAIILASGFGLFAITWKNTDFNRALLCGIICVLLMACLFTAGLGWFRDWDTIAQLGLLLGFLVMREDNVAGYVLGFLLWIGVNIAAPLERFNDGMSCVTVSMDVRVSSLENVRKYYEFKGDIPKQLDVLKSIILLGEEPYRYVVYARTYDSQPDPSYVSWLVNKMATMPTDSLLKKTEGVSIIEALDYLTCFPEAKEEFNKRHNSYWKYKNKE